MRESLSGVSPASIAQRAASVALAAQSARSAASMSATGISRSKARLARLDVTSTPPAAAATASPPAADEGPNSTCRSSSRRVSFRPRSSATSFSLSCWPAGFSSDASACSAADRT